MPEVKYEQNFTECAPSVENTDSGTCLDVNFVNNLSKLFINYAELWKNKARKEDTIKRLTIDPHSPPEFRVNGVLRNIDEFYRIFNIKPSDKLYLSPELRARIWI